jgi:hypothetical protein
MGRFQDGNTRRTASSKSQRSEPSAAQPNTSRARQAVSCGVCHSRANELSPGEGQLGMAAQGVGKQGGSPEAWGLLRAAAHQQVVVQDRARDEPGAPFPPSIFLIQNSCDMGESQSTQPTNMKAETASNSEPSAASLSGSTAAGAPEALPKNTQVPAGGRHRHRRAAAISQGRFHDQNWLRCLSAAAHTCPAPVSAARTPVVPVLGRRDERGGGERARGRGGDGGGRGGDACRAAGPADGRADAPRGRREAREALAVVRPIESSVTRHSHAPLPCVSINSRPACPAHSFVGPQPAGRLNSESQMS